MDIVASQATLYALTNLGGGEGMGRGRIALGPVQEAVTVCPSPSCFPHLVHVIFHTPQGCELALVYHALAAHDGHHRTLLNLAL